MADTALVETQGLLVAVALAYGWVALGYARAGRYGMALAFVAYAVGNLGFILDMKR